MARPSQTQLDRQLELIQTLVGKHEGIGLGDLEEVLRQHDQPIPRRTLIRRLAQLVDEGRLAQEGEGRGTKYRTAPPIPPTKADEKSEFPLSDEGARIRALVRRPIIDRQPVGYDAKFLQSYRPGSTWYLARSLRKHLHEVGRTPDADRPAGTFAHDIYERLLIDLAWASSRLEGNTYSRLDTQNLLEYGQRAEGKDASEAQMILNHKAAIQLLVENADEVAFNRHTLLNLHGLLSENLLGDSSEEGRLRRRVVEIGGTTYTPLSIPQKIEEFFDLILVKTQAIPDPFEQAFFAMVHIPYLQPFTDANKRTSRLAANIPLIKANLSPLSFIDVPERTYVDGLLGVYELRRVELLRDLFGWAYERSCAQYRVVRDSLGQPDPIRLRYRSELSDAVRETVLGLTPPRKELLRGWAASHGVPAGDVETFADMALGLLLDLHEGSLVRYRLRPSEFERWRTQFSTSTATSPASQEDPAPP